MDKKLTATEMFAVANGIELRRGDHRCFYCGAPCDETEPSKNWIKPTTMVRDIVANPAGDYVCLGCKAAFDEKATIQVADEPSPRVGKKTRNFSYVITANDVRGYTKSHIAILRETCVNPPEPPFVIAIADSGQKHILYLAPVNYSKNVVRVLLEENVITYRPNELAERISLAEKLIAVTGKPALIEEPGTEMFWKCHEQYGSLDYANEWLNCWREPLSRLALWLSRNKEDSKHEHIGR